MQQRCHISALAEKFGTAYSVRFGDRDRASSMFVREIPSNYVVKWNAQDKW